MLSPGWRICVIAHALPALTLSGQAGLVLAGSSEVHSFSGWPDAWHEDDPPFPGLCGTEELVTSFLLDPATSVFLKLPCKTWLHQAENTHLKFQSCSLGA